ncbi:MAG: 50S ribosomal protein L23 [Planctomycetota bacterium]
MTAELGTYDVIKSPLITEKLTYLNERDNVYGFWVDRRANKIQIKNAVEKIWDVKVLKVNTMIRKGKPRRVKWHWHHEPARKRALVWLAAGQRIE